MKISEFLLQTLEKSGVTHIFGNPGTTEIPLVRACEKRKKLKYVVALSEVASRFSLIPASHPCPATLCVSLHA